MLWLVKLNLPPTGQIGGFYPTIYRVWARRSGPVQKLKSSA